MTTTLRVHFDGSVLVPEQPVDLPIGRSVEIHIEDIPATPPGFGTAQALLAALRAAPPVSEEDVAELERVIAEGRVPVRWKGEFDNEEAGR